MALVPCAECGREISSSATACPACGHPVRVASLGVWDGEPPQTGPVKRRSAWPWVVGVPVVLAAAFVALGSGGDAGERGTARRAIELCWQDQQRKSLDPATARFAAGACEMMEQRFRETYRAEP